MATEQGMGAQGCQGAMPGSSRAALPVPGGVLSPAGTSVPARTIQRLKT